MPCVVIQYLDFLQMPTFTHTHAHPTHTHTFTTLPRKDFRAVPDVTELSELLRLDFNNCHMFGRYDTVM